MANRHVQTIHLIQLLPSYHVGETTQESIGIPKDHHNRVCRSAVQASALHCRKRLLQTVEAGNRSGEAAREERIVLNGGFACTKQEELLNVDCSHFKSCEELLGFLTDRHVVNIHHIVENTGNRLYSDTKSPDTVVITISH